jgi:hypothetical protein
MTFQEAAFFLGREIPPPSPLSGSRTGRKPQWEPRVTAAPGDLWQARARQLVADGIYNLWAPQGKNMVDFLLNERGLTEATIKKFLLGFLPLDRYAAAPEWGLEEILKENGQPKKLWIPMGLSIPLCHGDQVLRVRIRRPEPGDGPRYYLLRGSDTRAMVLGQDKGVYVLVESELDAILLAQEAGDLVGVVALGNAQARPDTEAMEALGHSRLILVALDDDDAGAQEAQGWWKSHFCQANRWPPLGGKDPGDMLKAGRSLRTWIEAGLAEYAGITTQPESEPEPEPQPNDVYLEPTKAPGESSPSNLLTGEADEGIEEIIELALTGELAESVLLPVRPAFRDILGNSAWLCPDQASAKAKAPDLAFSSPEELIEVLPLLTKNRPLAAALIEGKRIFGGTIVDSYMADSPNTPVLEMPAHPSDAQAHKEEKAPGSGKPSQEGMPREGWHLVKIKGVKGELHNFKQYTGPRAVMEMEVLEGGDAGKTIIDRISLPHPMESQGKIQRRLRICYQLGLVSKGSSETVQLNFKSLEGLVCWVNVVHHTFAGRKVALVDQYQIQPKTA